MELLRTGLYDEYYTFDLTDLTEEQEEELSQWSFDCLTTVAALGFGDIPVAAFKKAVDLVREDGWLAFNIKETFFSPSDKSGFSSYIRELIFSERFEVFRIDRYRHRLSMEGVPLYYYAVVGRKREV